MGYLSTIHKEKESNASWLTAVGSKLKTGINNLFKPEVVEVTFKLEGDNVTYTYTKVEEKKVA